MKRSLNKKRGMKAEFRICDYLNSIGMPTSVTSSLQDWPDIVTENFTHNYGLEAKSIKPISGNKVGRIKITKLEWNKLIAFCKANNAEPKLVVELNIPRTENLYFWVEGAHISRLFKAKETARKKKFLSLTVWQVIRLGDKLG